MKFLYILLVSIGVSYCSQEREHTIQQALQRCTFTIPIRVLIQECDLQEPFTWTFGSDKGFIICDSADSKKKFFYATSQLVITNTDTTTLTINNKRTFSKDIIIISCADKITYNTSVYEGAFVIALKNNKVYLVNHIDLEDYVLSVLPSESWPGWPDEVNKALCISIRSYGITKVLEQRALRAKKKQALPYDIKSSSIHQVYKGYTQNSKFKTIVDSTQGIVLAHNNKPILAMFDICCGGVIPAHKKGIDFTKAPYFARTYACTYCKEYKFYQWSYSYSAPELEQALIPLIKDLKLEDISVTHKDQAGTVAELAVKHKKSWLSYSIKKIKSSIKNLKSLCFTVKRSRNNYIFTGKGHGHHWGLCQWGACQMAKEGWNYKAILKFYYPGIQFMQLKRLG